MFRDLRDSLFLSTPFLIVFLLLNLGCGETSNNENVIIIGTNEALSAKISLGALPAGGRKVGYLRLRNGTNERIEITELETSCECLTIQGLPDLVVGKQDLDCNLIIDLGSAPNYVGTLAIEATAYDAARKKIFRLLVVATVPELEASTLADSGRPSPTPMP